MTEIKLKMTKKLFYIFLSLHLFALLCFGLCSCNSSNEQNHPDNYDLGYEDGWDKAVVIMLDELESAEHQNNEMFQLMFESIYTGDELQLGDTLEAGNFKLRYHIERNNFLFFDIKFDNFDLKTICDSYDNYVNNFPITCYIGKHGEDGEITVHKEFFVGENIFCDDYFAFTSDGYLTDYETIEPNIDTLYILLFVNNEAYATKYKLIK